MSTKPGEGGPHLLSVMYDSIRGLEAAVETLAKEQGQANLTAERMRADIAVIKNTLRNYDGLTSDVSELKKKMWGIALVGGLLAGIATTLVGTALRSALVPNPPYRATPDLPPKELPHDRIPERPPQS